MNTPVSDFDKGMDAGLRQGRLNGRREVINALRKGMPPKFTNSAGVERCYKHEYVSQDWMNGGSWYRKQIISLLSEIEKNV